MKPLPSVPVVEEDQWILAAVGSRLCNERWAYGLVREADRRDADLMLRAKQFPLCNCVGCPTPFQWIQTLALVRMGSYRHSFWPGGRGDGWDITYFA